MVRSISILKGSSAAIIWFKRFQQSDYYKSVEREKQIAG
jgi:hypothetical protein